MTPQYYEIDEKAQASARSMWSFSDYKTGSATAEYTQSVNEVYALAADAKTSADEKKQALIDRLCVRYAKNLAEYYNKSARIELMCPSILISGRGNFPIRQKEKQNISRDRNYKFYEEIQAIKEKISSMRFGSNIIASNDDNAIEKLKEKIAEGEKTLEMMKNANKHYRKYGTMKGFPDMSEDAAAELDKNIKGTSYRHNPFERYSLSNLNAKIRSTRQRLEGLERTKQTGTQEVEYQSFKVVRNTELMRLQLFFNDKPSDDVRCVLKKNGFKWAPSQAAWQRQLTNNAMWSYKSTVLPELKKLYGIE